VTRLLSLILAGAFLLSSIGCGNVFIGGAIRTGSTSRGSTMRGSVSTVEIGSVLNGTGGTVQVTFVTLLANGTFSTIGFCADQSSLFPLDQTVMVNFNPGQTCATVILVEIVG
jgi:hypothetical protein